MKKIEPKKRERVKKDLNYYKNLKKDIEKQIKVLAVKESVKKRKELYKKRAIIGKYMLDLFELEDTEIDAKNLGSVFDEFLSTLSQEDKLLFISNNEVPQDDNKEENIKEEEDNYDDYDDL